MVKKSLFHGLLLTSIFAVLSTANAMDTNIIEDNKNILKVTAKQLKKGFKQGSIDIEGKKYSVQSLSKPHFDLISMGKFVTGYPKEKDEFNFYYKKKNGTEVFNLNLKFQSDVPTESITFAPPQEVQTFFNKALSTQKSAHFIIYQNEDDSFTFYPSEKGKTIKGEKNIKIANDFFDKDDTITIPLDENFSLVGSPKRNLLKEILPFPIQFYLQKKDGTFVQTQWENKLVNIIIPTGLNKIIFKQIRKLDCFLNLAKPHYKYKNTPKQKFVDPVIDGKSLFKMMVCNPSIMNVILEDENYQIAREALTDFTKNKFSNLLTLVGEEYRFKYLKNALKILKVFSPNHLILSSISEQEHTLTSKFIEGNDRLTHIRFSNYPLDSNNVICIWNSLKNNPRLTLLDFTGNKVSAQGIQDLCDSLKKNKTLTSLVLHGTKIDAPSFKSICEVLKNNNSLTNLNLGYSKPDKEGIEILSDALQNNQSLAELGLYATNLDNEKIEILSKSLKVNTGLKKLNLDNNKKIGDEGIQYLLDALLENKSLIELEIDSSKIDNQLMSEIKEALNLKKNQKK
jgi:hypothetical protein